MDLTKEELKRMYEQDNMSLYQIAKQTGLTFSQVRRRCKKYEVKMRPFSTKGRTPRLGAVLSEETKAKIAKAHQGKVLSPEHRAKVIKTLRYGLIGSDNQAWKGGIHFNRDGYRFVRIPDHPDAYSNGYVKFCRLLAVQKYGRQIRPDEDVHHVNGDKRDDRLENIVLLTHGEHARIHRNQEALVNNINKKEG